MNNKGATLAGLLASLVLSSIILITISRIFVFILNVEQETVLNSRVMNESAILLNDFQVAFDSSLPYECLADTPSAGIYTCNGVIANFTIEIVNQNTIKMDDVVLNLSSEIVEASFTPSDCSNCSSNGIFVLKFGLKRQNTFTQEDVITYYRASYRVKEVI